MKRQDRGTAESLLDGICMYKHLVVVLFAFSAVMLLLTLGSYVVVEPGTATYVVVILNMIGLTGFLVVSGAILLLCRQRTE